MPFRIGNVVRPKAVLLMVTTTAFYLYLYMRYCTAHAHKGTDVFALESAPFMQPSGTVLK